MARKKGGHRNHDTIWLLLLFSKLLSRALLCVGVDFVGLLWETVSIDVASVLQGAFKSSSHNALPVPR